MRFILVLITTVVGKNAKLQNDSEGNLKTEIMLYRVFWCLSGNFPDKAAE